MVKRIIFLFLLCNAFLTVKAQHAHDTTTKAKTANQKSIAQEEHAQIGETHITILYTAPAVRDRIIWGGLVPYGEVWVTGAHRATSIEIDHEFMVDGKKIPAGKYGIFTIPGKDHWTFILNKKWDQHLTDEYNPTEDVLRVEAKPRTLSDVQERLNYTLTELSETEAVLSVSWEKLKINIPLKLNAH